MGIKSVANKWLYRKVVRAGRVGAETSALAERGLTSETKLVSKRRARRHGGIPTEFREINVHTEAKDEWLSKRGYVTVAQSLRSGGPPIRSKKHVGDQSQAIVAGHPADSKLIDELRANEVFCRANRGSLPRQIEARVGGGVRKGERKGQAIEVSGTCTRCLSIAQQRWRFYPAGIAGRAIFLCGICIQQIRNKRATGGDAMHKAVFRRRSRG